MTAFLVCAYAQMRNGNYRKRILTVNAKDKKEASEIASIEIMKDPEVSRWVMIEEISQLEEGGMVWEE